MEKSLEEVLDGLTGHQIWIIVLKIWSALGGRDKGAQNVLRLLAGELRIIIEEVKIKPVVRPLVGKVLETLHLSSNMPNSILKAIVPCGFDSDNTRDRWIPEFIGVDEMRLVEPTDVDLVQFDHGALFDEVLAWGKENNRKPILLKHLFAIGTQYPETQRHFTIIEYGWVCGGKALCLEGSDSWRRLSYVEAGGRRSSDCVFGFVKADPVSDTK